MSYDTNNVNNTDTSKNVKENIISNVQNSTNIIFHCDQCKRVPLIIPSNINYKMIKYCKNQKMTEIISPINLINMINIKNINKKDISKDNLKINDNNFNFDEFICSSHGREFINYCCDCSKDICYFCSKDHFKHNLIHFSKFLPSNRDIREGNKILSEMKKDLEKFKQNSKEIIKVCSSLIYLKEKILNALNSIDFKKLNFYSIMNYKNILKIKIKLNEKQYYSINPLSEVNSNLLQSIKNHFETDSFIQKNNNQQNKTNYLKIPNNSQENNINNSYQKFLEVLEKMFDFNNINDNITEKIDINAYSEKTINNNKIYENTMQFNNNHNNFLHLEKKFDFPNFFKSFDDKKNQNILFEPQDNSNIVKEIKLNDSNENEFIEEINKKNNIPNISEFEKSTIMDNNETIFIINLITSKIKKKIKKFYLCYKATKDGDKAANFHEKCDYIKNIIILIKTKNNKKFGGFSSESWDNNDQTWKKDEQAFIFSLNDYNSYNIIKTEKALFCHKKYGPIFGNGEIFISDNFFTIASTCLEKNVIYESNENSYPLNGEKEFYITQLEAYKVDFELNNEDFQY